MDRTEAATCLAKIFAYVEQNKMDEARKWKAKLNKELDAVVLARYQSPEWEAAWIRLLSDGPPR
tara:strand:- start:1856 stop:2047 length:192 start_codon:yes stop_codon:yes gene_type:complete